MADDQIDDAIEQTKGRIKEAAGVLTGKQDLEQEGEAQQEKVEARQQADQKAAEAQQAAAEARAAEADQKRAQHS